MPTSIKVVLILLFHLLFEESYLEYDTIYEVLVWLRSSSNPADIIQFRSHTGILNTLLLTRHDNSMKLYDCFYIFLFKINGR